MYTSLDQVGKRAGNPFESGANDVPIARSCDDIETDLRELLGDTGVSAPSKPKSDITEPALAYRSAYRGE